MHTDTSATQAWTMRRCDTVNQCLYHASVEEATVIKAERERSHDHYKGAKVEHTTVNQCFYHATLTQAWKMRQSPKLDVTGATTMHSTLRSGSSNVLVPVESKLIINHRFAHEEVLTLHWLVLAMHNKSFISWNDDSYSNCFKHWLRARRLACFDSSLEHTLDERMQRGTHTRKYSRSWCQNVCPKSKVM